MSRELRQDINIVDQSVQDGNPEPVQQSQRQDSFRERQKREERQVQKQKSKNSERNLKQCNEGRESLAEVHNKGFILDEGKNDCKVVIGKETKSIVVSPDSGIIVQGSTVPSITDEIEKTSIQVETISEDAIAKEQDLLVFESQTVGLLDVSVDSAVDVFDNFDSSMWPIDDEDCADISLKEKCRESLELVESTDRPSDCDITQTKTIVDDTKLQQQKNPTWKTDKETEASGSLKNKIVLDIREGGIEDASEGTKEDCREISLKDEESLEPVESSEGDKTEAKTIENTKSQPQENTMWTQKTARETDRSQEESLNGITEGNGVKEEPTKEKQRVTTSQTNFSMFGMETRPQLCIDPEEPKMVGLEESESRSKNSEICVPSRKGGQITEVDFSEKERSQRELISIKPIGESQEKKDLDSDEEIQMTAEIDIGRNSNLELDSVGSQDQDSVSVSPNAGIVLDELEAKDSNEYDVSVSSVSPLTDSLSRWASRSPPSRRSRPSSSPSTKW